MRPDMVQLAVFLDYELSDHTGPNSGHSGRGPQAAVLPVWQSSHQNPWRAGLAARAGPSRNQTGD